MPSTFPTLKKGTPPQIVELDQSELRVLKDLASSFRNVDISQLEALLHAREASLPDINADGVKPSILAPLDTSGTVGLRFRLGGARPASEPRPSVPSAFDAGPKATPKRPSKSPTPTHSTASASDSSFINARINQSDSSRPTNINNYSNNQDTYILGRYFNDATIEDRNIQSHSQNTYCVIGSSRDCNHAEIDGSDINSHSFNDDFTPSDLDIIGQWLRYRT